MVKRTADLAQPHDPKLKSQLYVFAFENHRDYATWEAMRLEQWEFFVLPAKALLYKSISLKSLRAGFPALNAQSLRGAVEKAANYLQATL